MFRGDWISQNLSPISEYHPVFFKICCFILHMNGVALRVPILLALIIHISVFEAKAQLDFPEFQRVNVFDSAQAGNAYLTLYTLGFGKNNEYFNNIIEGYTLFGYQLNPGFSYVISPNLRLDAGLYIQKDFGNQLLSAVEPVFTLAYKKEWFEFNFGTLEGSLSHGLIEPLYHFENVLNNRLENGFQIKADSRVIQADLWIDWRHMIYPGDAEREKLNGGFVGKIDVLKNPHHRLSIPLQGLVYHEGGQINQGVLPVVTLMNNSAGLEYMHIMPDYWLRSVSLSSHWVGFNKFKASGTLPFTSGYGYYANFYLKSEHIDVLTSYWHGHNFISFMGSPIFRSVSLYNIDYTENLRELLFLRVQYRSKLYDGFYLSARFEPVYDLRNRKLDHALGLYLNYKTAFFLFKRRS
jgi:hypothetical protein